MSERPPVEAGEYARLLRYHSRLIGGRGRIAQYAKAIRATVSPGDRVIDLGAGTGVLALLAARAGAHVFAVEDSPAISLARRFVEVNGLSDRITVVERTSRLMTLSKPADVLVTDTYDSFGLQGGLLGSVLDARERLVKPDGALVPRALVLRVAPLSSAGLFSGLVEPWSASVEGFDFTLGRGFALNGLQVGAIGDGELLGGAETVIELDLARALSSGVSGDVSLLISRDGELHGLAGWFSAELAPGVFVSNAPGSDTTPYLQAWLPIASPVDVRAGDEVSVHLESDDGASWAWDVTVRGTATFSHSTDRSFPEV